MPYNTPKELPGHVRRHLPMHARQIHLKAFNSAWDQYADAAKRRGRESREVTAHRVAWAAVEKSYKKGAGGRWVRR